MKKVLTKFIAFGSIGLLMLSACKKSGTEVMDTGSKSSALTASTTTLVLDKTKLNDTSAAIMFTVTAPAYNFKAVVKNYLQIDAAGDNWKNPTQALLSAKGGSQGYSTADFNSLLLKLNLPAGAASQVNVRVANELSSDVATYSNVVALTVTPFNLASFVYVPGNYEGWSFPGPAADSLLSATDNGVYTGVIGFKAVSDPFLIVPIQSWNNKWATTQNPGANGGPITYSTEYVSSGGNNFFSASVGTVDPAVNITSDKVVFDSNKNTLTLTPTLWSVVGDASPGGWPNSSGPQSDTDMKFNNATQTWSVVVALTATGTSAIKFRLNHDWGTNLGGSGGTLTSGRANIIPPSSGTYLVTLDPVALTYTLTKQ